MERALRCNVRRYFFACVGVSPIADVARAQFAEESVWVGENYTSRDEMRNALYSRAKVSCFDVLAVLGCTGGLADELLQFEGFSIADFFESACTT